MTGPSVDEQPAVPAVRRLGRARRAAGAVLAIAALALPAIFMPGTPEMQPRLAWSADNPTTSLATFAVIFAIVALSFGTLMRLSGLPSVAHGALWGVGAYTAGALVTHLDWGFLASVGPAIVVPAAVAALIAIPAFRTSGVAFLVISMVLGEFLVLVITNAGELTGGTDGLAIVGSDAHLGPFELDVLRDRYYVSLGFLYLAILTVWLIARSRLGRRLEMIRDNEPLARSLGLSPLRYKLIIFTVTAGMAGAAGQLYLYQQQAIEPDLFSVYAFIPIILAAVLGGIRWIAGPVIGAYVVAFLPTWFGRAGLDDPNTRTLVYGVLLIVVISIAPKGVVGLFMSARTALIALIARRRETGAVEPSVAPAAAVPIVPMTVPSMAPGTLLCAEDVSKRFGAVHALDRVDVTVKAGEILGMIGPNGSGKTTLFNCVTGFVTCDGSIVWQGRRQSSPSPHRLARAGLVRTFQHPEAFASMTPRESCSQVLAIDRDQTRANGLPVDADALLAFCGLGPVGDLPFSSLSYGQQRLLGVMLALAARPLLLMLDEPAAGLNDLESRDLRSLLEAVRSAGVTIVVVDHDMTFLLPLCDRVVVLDAGRVMCDGDPHTVMERPDVVSAYLGERFSRPVEMAAE